MRTTVLSITLLNPFSNSTRTHGPAVIGSPAFLAARARKFSLLVITFPFIPGVIRIIPSSFCMPSPRQMMVSPISRSRGSFQGTSG